MRRVGAHAREDAADDGGNQRLPAVRVDGFGFAFLRQRALVFVALDVRVGPRLDCDTDAERRCDEQPAGEEPVAGAKEEQRSVLLARKRQGSQRADGDDGKEVGTKSTAEAVSQCFLSGSGLSSHSL